MTAVTSLFPGLVLLLGVADDLRSQKIHNSLIIVLFVCSLIYVSLVFGWSEIISALGKCALAFLLTAPLVLGRVIGGGDMKLYMVLALSISVIDLLYGLLFSFFWAAVLGLVKIILDKKLRLLGLNLYTLLKFQKVSVDEMSTFPFSVSLFLGWLSVTFHNSFL